jgi:tRNA nucleotidyltransferase (CCA-adding enzyme)
MKIYLVGGAVRDRLLGRPETERDWLVTGTTPEQMLALGYRRVGRDFPVFLHPETHEEYALPRHARGEESTRPATLEGDLARRDLTVNAMALGPDGELIDPCGGRRDLEQRILRHTPAFEEDPLRVLRLARFAARFQPLGFRVAEETCALVGAMARRGELDRLIPERVFAEISRAIMEEQAPEFFRVLRECGALAPILPELDRLFGVPQPERHHPEIDSGLHSLQVLEQACRFSEEPEVRFAALLHDLGKGATPKNEWPRHIAHEKRGVPMIESLCARLRIPNRWRDLATLTARYHLDAHRAKELRPTTLLKLLEALDAVRRPERFEQFLLACRADRLGRPGREDRPYPQAEYLRAVRTAAAAVDNREITQGFSGHEIERQLRLVRLDAISEVVRRFPWPES